ncbi:MAG: DNA starvation/stationary phase protection protein [Chlamydiales bacterium]|nr:DNA starvation/stationary phase protection protein [Chlamydiales bacterium]
MEISSGMNEKSRKVVSDGLSKLLAETYALYLKTQNFHWNVVGSDFFALHLLFEKQYEELSGAIDEIAERIRALGAHVDATFSGFKKLSSISEEGKLKSSNEMIKHLVKANECVICLARKLTEVAEKERDQATLDLLARRLGAHEKSAWMLRSHL